MKQLTDYSKAARVSLSVIMPTFNRGSVLIETLRHTLQVIDSRWEVVVVDDGSTDDTAERLARSGFEGKIRYVHCGRNGGVCAAKNLGIEHAAGDIFVFLDSDDVFAEGAPAYIADFFEANPDVGILFGACKTKDGRSVSHLVSGERAYSYDDLLAAELVGEYLPICRKRVFQNLRFENELRGFENITWLKAARAGIEIVYSDVALRVYEDAASDRLCHVDSLLKNPARLARGFQAYLDEFGQDLAERSPHRLEAIVQRIVLYSALAGHRPRARVPSRLWRSLSLASRARVMGMRLFPAFVLAALYRRRAKRTSR